MAENEGFSSGLEGIVVAETQLSDVDGEHGRLVLRGHPVEELALEATFEDAAALFLEMDAATARQRLGEARLRAHERMPRWGDALDAADNMSALRAALAHGDDGDAWDAAGTLAVALAAWWRRRQGLEPVLPDASAGHAQDLLRLCTGGRPREALVRALDTYLVTVIDHGMNASTFAARVVASTGTDLRSALVAGMGALKGPLHGGAPGPVLDLLDLVGSPPRATEVVARELEAGRRIMGMGHRVYRVRDPRAFVLEQAIERLAPHVEGRVRERLVLARAVEEAAEAALALRHPTRPLKANVEFFTAVLLDAIGIDRTLFSGVFACSRVIGWSAHVEEQRRTGRLIRPASRYVGPSPALLSGSPATSSRRERPDE